MTTTTTTPDLFAGLAAAFETGVRLFADEPHLAALAARLSQPVIDEEARVIHQQLAERRFAGVLQLVRGAKAAGAVRADVDDEVAAELIVQWLGAGLLALLARQLGSTVDELLAAPARVAQLDGAVRTRLTAQAVGLVRRALAPPCRDPAQCTEKLDGAADVGQDGPSP